MRKRKYVNVDDRSLPEEDLPGFFLKDEERSAFGLGYEDCRRGREYVNPFSLIHWKWEHYRNGYTAMELRLKGEEPGRKPPSRSK